MRAAGALWSMVKRGAEPGGFRSILCPVDFSDYSRRALRYAAAIALRGKATLTVVYVNDPLLAAAAAATRDRDPAGQSAQELRAFVSATIPAKTRTGLRLTSLVSTGDPADEILGFSDGRTIDLIVIGTHGLTGFERLIMGSTTRRVLQRAKVPVLVIPRDCAEI